MDKIMFVFVYKCPVCKKQQVVPELLGPNFEAINLARLARQGRPLYKGDTVGVRRQFPCFWRTHEVVTGQVPVFAPEPDVCRCCCWGNQKDREQNPHLSYSQFPVAGIPQLVAVVRVGSVAHLAAGQCAQMMLKPAKKE
jgi:hypothetical protein